MSPSVTVSMPYYRTPDTVERAVRCVLDQTHRDLTLVVVNDGDNPATAWPPLTGVDDERLIRFDLPENRGRYYCDAVTLAACDTPWFTVHDSDDQSNPDHLATLLTAASGRDMAVGGFTRHRDNGVVTEHPPAPQRLPRMRPITHLAAVLWSTTALRSLGGPHPEWRIAYDTLLMALGVAHLDWAQVATCSYHHVARSASLTTSLDTGMYSASRAEAHRLRRHVWAQVRDMPLDELAGCEWLTPTPSTAVARDADRLRGMIERSTGCSGTPSTPATSRTRSGVTTPRQPVVL